ncbi:MAG: hypothetical protein LAP38_10735 [Acidobacteriia bacterium]|nr:hypothetical protein [Terriglobia bacterium]
MYRERSLAFVRKPAFWRAYIPFAAILIGYSGYFFADAGLASLSGRRTGGFYGFHNVSSALAGLIRAWINLALPFSMLPLGFKTLLPQHLAILAGELCLALLAVWRAKALSVLVLAAGWLFFTILPTAAFAAAFNSDRYLFVPFLGVAIFLGLLLDRTVKSDGRALYKASIWTALGVYAGFAWFQLSTFRDLYKRAGSEAAQIVRVTVDRASRLPAGGEVDLVDVTAFLDPYIVPVFSTSLGGALQANGLSPSIRILQNLKADSPEQRRLISGLLACPHPPGPLAGDRIVLLATNGQVQTVDSSCAAPQIDADRSQRPKAWRFADAF